ncbi:MAG: hypothetical protein HRU03_00175 [Nanoarchaeales archaeon]|nr:hypothetical protein [Nanoarchaeales archaeon]
MINNIKISLKRILSVLLVAVMCCSFVFSDTLESSSGKEINPTSTEKEYVIYFTNTYGKGSNTRYELNGFTQEDIDKGFNNLGPIAGITQNTIDKSFKSYDDAKTAHELNKNTGSKINSNDELDEKIKEMRSDPLNGDNKKILNSLKLYMITTEGYQKIANDNILHIEEIKRLKKSKKGKSTEDKVKIQEKIDILDKKLKVNQKELDDTPPTLEQQGELLAGLTDDERLEVLDGINKKECSGVKYVPFCELILGSNAKQAIKASFVANIQDFGYDETKEGTYIEQQNKYIYAQLSKTYPNLNCKSSSSCRTQIENLEKNPNLITMCNGDVSCQEDKIDEMKNMEKYAEGFNEVETNWVYSLIDAIKNPDALGISAAKAFGIQTYYDDLPKWLTEQGLAVSYICIGDIHGYLDDESSLGGTTIIGDGSLTKYSYDIGGDDYGRSGDVTTLEVVYDIRAKMTRITPNGETGITISVYLKAPHNINITYMLGIGYKSGDEYINKILGNNESTINKGETFSELIPIDLEVENPSEVVESSFFLYLKVRTGNGVVVANDNVNIYLVTKGTKLDDILGNSNGHNQDSTNDDVEQDTDTFFDDLDWNNG